MPSIIRATTINGLQVAPDNSGSLVLQTNGTTTAVTIDTSQNVGIGTTSPSQRLHVRSNNGQILAEATGTNENPSLKFTSVTNNRNWEVFSWSGVSGQFGIYDGIAGQNRLLIDTSGNLQFNSGYGSVATAYGCRAWVNFNGVGTIAIRNSANVTSITDNGTGDYTINFTTSMPDANYCGVALPNDGTPGTNLVVGCDNQSRTKTVSAFHVWTAYGGNGVNKTLYDVNTVNVAIFR
jgi:hypothetical protein